MPSGTFEHQTAVWLLDLSHNSISSLPEDVFSTMISLNYIYLDYNQLTSLPSAIFNNNPYLYYVSVGGGAWEELLSV